MKRSHDDYRQRDRSSNSSYYRDPSSSSTNVLARETSRDRNRNDDRSPRSDKGGERSNRRYDEQERRSNHGSARSRSRDRHDQRSPEARSRDESSRYERREESSRYSDDRMSHRDDDRRRASKRSRDDDAYRQSSREDSSNAHNDVNRSVRDSQQDEEVDYDALYESSSASLQRKTAVQLFAEKQKKLEELAAKSARASRDVSRALSSTPGPSEMRNGTVDVSGPSTPGGSSLPQAVRDRLQVASREATPSGSATPLHAAEELEEGEDREAAHAMDLVDLTQNATAAETQLDDQHRNHHQSRNDSVRNDAQEISAADYNPGEDLGDMDDRREREKAFGLKAGEMQSVSDNAQAESKPSKQSLPVEADEAEEEDVEDDEDDMFALEPKKKKARITRDDDAATRQGFVPMISRQGMTGGDNATLVVDNFDDAEGYYRIIIGETLDANNRYHVHANLGKGMFANVVRVKDTQNEGRELAVKVIRSQESMYRAGQKEATILKKLNDADPQDKKHIVRLDRTFEHRGHLCIVFESMSMNLRDVVKRFGKDVGINLRAVRAYAHQMFLALNLMRKLNIMHADIKPDNILVNESKSVLKICDFGSAADASEAEITPYLVSRFYRAPEIILGLPYDCSLDMWSIGCTLYELYTGKILLPGRSNNHMLLLVQELKGRYPARLVKKAKFGETHFEEASFVYVDKDKKSGSESIKKIVIPPQPSNSLKTRLMPIQTVKKMQDDELKLLTNFVSLLDKCMELDPARRLTPKEALNHPFLR